MGDCAAGDQVGAWLAYDPVRGRLWSICRSCRHWNLTPLEDRWETVEELERLVGEERGSDRARLLTKTDHIALYDREGERIVRVGDASLSEEAWWRYGHRLRRRWQVERRISVGGAATVGAAIIGGILSAALPARYALRSPGEVRRWLRFGDRAWIGHARCQRCGHTFTELSFFDRTIVRLRPRDEGSPALVRRCPGCGDDDRGGLHLTGVQGEETLLRLLAYDHHPGVSEGTIKQAMDLIDREGEPARLVRVLLRHTRQLGDLPLAATTALEVAANEQREMRLLRLEARELERYWREAETLASIVDGELTDLPRVERLRIDATARL